MSKRNLAVLLVLFLVGGLFSAIPVGAQEAPPEVPAEPNVTDPVGDANYLNDQGVAPRDGDHTGPADASTSADLMAGWFTNDAASVTAHILVEGALPSTPSYFYRVHVDPAGGEDDCLWFQAGIPGVADAGAGPDPIGNLRNNCGDGSIVDGEVSLAENPDGGTIVSIKVPMGTHGLAVGMTLGSPNVTVRNWPRTPAGSATAPQVDNTKLGTPYMISAGGPNVEPDPEPTAEPPGKDDPPGKGKKKGCKKGKGKKKGACPGKKSKKPKPPAAAKCEAYTPGEEGKDAPLTVVTEAATEEAPVEVLIEQGPGLFPAASSDAFGNIQVDTGGAEAGLYIAYEFPVYEDHDLYLNYADGSEAARAAGFNQFPFVPGETDGTGNGGHSEQGAEMIDGLRTPDCAGYTARFNSFIGEGGEYTVKLWLGEIQNDPAAPGGGGQAVDLFFVLLGL